MHSLFDRISTQYEDAKIKVGRILVNDFRFFSVDLRVDCIPGHVFTQS